MKRPTNLAKTGSLITAATPNHPFAPISYGSRDGGSLTQTWTKTIGTGTAATVQHGTNNTTTMVDWKGIAPVAGQIQFTVSNLGTGALNFGRVIESAITFSTWASAFLPTDVSNPNGDNDGDGLKNIEEFAFGTNPTQSSGAITFDENGNVTNGKGTPVAKFMRITETAVDFRAVFSRRKDHQAAGLVYTVQFSPGLGQWVDHTYKVGEPILLDGSDADIEVV